MKDIMMGTTPMHSIVIVIYYTIIDYWGMDMMWYRPESTNIYQGGAEVNIGILRSI